VVAIAQPFARKTQRVGELVRLFAHAAGGRVSERLLTRLGNAYQPQRHLAATDVRRSRSTTMVPYLTQSTQDAIFVINAKHGPGLFAETDSDG
jgi:hypothetical protein